MQLNPKQAEAKNKVEGPLLILAGAGSGKTATLTARVQYMIAEKNIAPESILMVTFTNKAASEMRARVARTLGVPTPRNLYAKSRFPLIGTFHSIGIYILKETLKGKYSQEISEKIGLKKDFVIYDESDKISVLKGIIKDDLGLIEKEYPARQVAFYISNAKNNLINAAQYEAEVDSSIKEVVFKAYQKYEEKMRQNNALDFDDILWKTFQVVQIPRVLEIYQERYKYLMVDEYQDTNLTQYKIIELLASKYKNLAVVGDDSQSIYSWRGADMRNIINFKRDYPDALSVKLEQNYRSTKNILAGANAVIQNNSSGIKKELWSDKPEGNKIQYITAPDDKTEASIISSIIAEKKAWSENLILYRTNAQSRRIEEALMIKNIPYRVIGGMKFYDRKEIKDIIGYLKVLHNPDDIVSMKRVINTPSRKIGARSIEILDTYRESFGASYLQLIENLEEIEELKPAARSALQNFQNIYLHLKQAASKLQVSDLIQEIRKITQYDHYITDGLSQEEKTSKLENLDELITVASEYNGLAPAESLGIFLEEIALITDIDTKDTESEYVTLMTIHTSKGLEQKRVFVTGLEDGIFPGFRSLQDPAGLEEERRLMYVAMTRAEDELYISRSVERFQFGEYLRNPESRFIKEISPNTLENYDVGNFVKKDNPFDTMNSFVQSSNISTMSAVRKPKVENNVASFAVGDSIRHEKFGNGRIKNLSGEIATLLFASGEKKMNIRIAPVKKI